MDKLIPLMNQIHSIFAPLSSTSINVPNGNTGNEKRNEVDSSWIDSILDLPRIVAIGSQSSGKSSVIESLVGKDFLPRGKDVVTRRPLVLQLHRIEEGGEEYGEFSHRTGRIYDFFQIRREIETETLKVAGNNRGISISPIYLCIKSPRVVNLVLVDLPGMTKIPVGDQPPDIESQLRNLVMHYISPKNTLILAITPANNDLVNSDALKLARQVDPAGSRTLGVITKIDLMDSGTNAVDILSNKGSFSLRYGFVGIVCRSQQDIIHNKPIDEALRAESEFFRTHPAYRSVATKCGISFLAAELNKVKEIYLPIDIGRTHQIKATRNQAPNTNQNDGSSK
jgi:dynamin 1-like protein